MPSVMNGPLGRLLELLFPPLRRLRRRRQMFRRLREA
jgi:hypothetical protein